MANTLTLEEAARQLGLTVEQFKVNLKTHKDFRSIRPLMGGTTMHFREQDVQELARKLGLDSDPGLQLGDASSDPIIPAATDDDQVEIGREHVPSSGSSSSRLSSPSSKRLPKPPKQEELLAVGSDDSSVPLISEEPGKRSDSDVKLAKGSDSDVRLERKKGTAPGTPTEEIDLDAEARKRKGQEDSSANVFELADDGSKSGKSSGKISGKSGSHKATAKKPINNSDFELQLGSDSDSEFELTLADDSDEVDLGTLPRDVSGKKGKSGVKLDKPADSGISLEKDDSDSEFELNLDSSKSSKITGPKSGKKKPDSDSEFELTLDDSSGEVAKLAEGEEQKDIFATDFDIPALDEESGSEAVQLEDSDTDLESSDFDLALDDSGEVEESASEVVQLDEDLEGEEGAPSSKRKGKKARAMEEDEDEVAADEALAGVDEDEEEELAPVGAMAVPQQKPWGPLPALVLFPCLFLMMIVTFMSFELLHGMWSYRQGGTKPTYTITRGIAGLFTNESELPKE